MNEFRARVFGTEESRLIGFICECADPDCRRTIMLTLEDYRRARPGLLVHDDHRAFAQAG